MSWKTFFLESLKAFLMFKKLFLFSVKKLCRFLWCLLFCPVASELGVGVEFFFFVRSAFYHFVPFSMAIVPWVCCHDGIVSHLHDLNCGRKIIFLFHFIFSFLVFFLKVSSIKVTCRVFLEFILVFIIHLIDCLGCKNSSFLCLFAKVYK